MGRSPILNEKIKLKNYDDECQRGKVVSYNKNKYTLQHPCYGVLLGKSGTGKTNCLMNLLFEKPFQMSYNRVTIYCRDETQDKYIEIDRRFRELEQKIQRKTGQLLQLCTIERGVDNLPMLGGEHN